MVMEPLNLISNSFFVEISFLFNIGIFNVQVYLNVCDNTLRRISIVLFDYFQNRNVNNLTNIDPSYMCLSRLAMLHAQISVHECN